MRFTGKVTSKSENAEGHSQVRLSGVVLLAADVQPEEAPKVELIVSTASIDVIGAFRVNQAVEFDL